MSKQIIGLQASQPQRFHEWLRTPPGAYLQSWASKEFDQAVADVFGYHALQLGLPDVPSLRANRMPHVWQALDHTSELERLGTAATSALLTDFSALPFTEGSLDLVTLPHTLELNGDPHGCLREVHRVLVPEGRVVICGLNPTSFWGVRQSTALGLQRLGWGQSYIPEAQEWIGHRRLRDWLRLLSFEVESVRFGCHAPGAQTDRWLDRTAWMNGLGARWWPILGGVYFVVAVKRVRGVKALGPRWKAVPTIVNAPVSVANSAQSNRGETRETL